MQFKKCEFLSTKYLVFSLCVLVVWL